MNDSHRPQGQKLDGFNLQEVLDSGTNAADKGRQQFFTPPAYAEAFMSVLPRAVETFVDLTMGAGGLLLGAHAAHSLGVDIDPRCARKPAKAPGQWHTATADLTRLYPLLVETGWDFDLCGLNPPFSVRWHKDRLAALGESECDTVKRTFQRQGGDTIDSTLATFLIALDRMTELGEGYLVCNEATAIRFFGHPDDPAPPAHDCPRQHVWLWLSIPPGVFAGVRGFDTAVLFFARGHRGDDPVHVTASSASPAAVASALVPMQTRRYQIRGGRMVYRASDFSPRTVPAFAAAAQEYQAREEAGHPREFNLWLEGGRIRRHLTPFQSFSGRIPKEAAATLQKIEGKTPMELVVGKATRVELVRAVRSEYWVVDPALAAAVDAAVRAYNAHRAPFYPLNDVQRLGFLDEEDAIECRIGGDGFTAGRRYPIECSTETVSRDHRRPNLLGVMEDVTLSGQEMAIVVTDDAQQRHVFRVHDADNDGRNADRVHQRRPHPIATLLERFHVPEVPDVGLVHPEKFAANRARIAEIEAALGGFRARAFQRDDLSRVAVHDGGIISWDPGMGKTIAMFFLPQIKGARRTLIVAPEQLHEQIIDEGRTKFGVTVRPLPSQAAFYADADLRQAERDVRSGRESEVRGWWITSYTALGFNGGDEWEGKEDEDGRRIVTDRLLGLRRLHPDFRVGCDAGVGTTVNGITCTWAPSLATLTADLFDCVECDEGVRIKSNDSYTSLGVRRMRPAFRYVMTATPIKNHLLDIFWLAWWAAGGHAEATVRWRYAGTDAAKEHFANTFMISERNHTREDKARAAGNSRKIVRRLPQICNLHLLWKVLAGVVIRRRKDNSGESIVPKSHIPLKVKPGKAQQAVYRFHIANKPEFNADGQPMSPMAKILAQLTRLRQAAVCPDSENLSAPRISLQRMRDYLAEMRQPKAVAAALASDGKIAPGPGFYTGGVDPARTRKAALVAHKGERTPFEAEADVAFEIVERMIAQGGIDLDAIFEAAPKLAARLRELVDVEGSEPASRSWTDHNPKQAAILQLIHDKLSLGEQVMVLSPFQQFSESLYRRLVSAGVAVCLLDGKISPRARGKMAKAFKRKKYSVLIGGEQSMGEGGSFENCKHLVRPSLGWAYDVNRQCEDRIHRLTSAEGVSIYEFATENSIDQRLESLYHEKGDSSMLALDGSLFAERTDEINLGELLAEAIRGFDPHAETIDEQGIEQEWNHSLKAKLTQAERTFRQFHPAIVPDAEGRRVTTAEVRAAVRDAGIEPAAPAMAAPALRAGRGESPCVGIVRCVPSATFALLIDDRDPAAVDRVREEFIAFCQATAARDWRKAWAAYDQQRRADKPKPAAPAVPLAVVPAPSKARAARDFLAGL